MKILSAISALQACLKGGVQGGFFLIYVGFEENFQILINV